MLLTKRNSIILPETNQHADLQVCLYKTGFSSRVQSIQKTLKLNLQNYLYTFIDDTGHECIGNINWEESLKLNLLLKYFTLSLNPHQEFRELIRLGVRGEKKVLYADGDKKVDKKLLEVVADELYGRREPFGSEFIDAFFQEVNGVLRVNYDHILAGNKLIPRKSDLLGDYLIENCYVNSAKFNNQGLPKPNSKSKIQEYKRGKNIRYACPIKGRVARFSTDSVGAFLNCDRNPDDSYSWIGVRAAKIRE